jgi:hypothetical protein
VKDGEKSIEVASERESEREKASDRERTCWIAMGRKDRHAKGEKASGMETKRARDREKER